MRLALLALALFSPKGMAIEFSSDVRADRTGSVELFYGTDLSNHFFGSQYYVTDALMVRLHSLMIPHPDTDAILGLESVLETVGNTEPLPVSENEYRTFSIHPGAYYSIAQIGDESTAVVFQAGGQLLYRTEAKAEEYKEAMESIKGIVSSNAKKLFAHPSVGVAYVTNFETGSLEVDLASGPLIPVWGDKGYGTSEVDGTKYDGTQLMGGGWSSLLQLGYRWKRLVVIAGAAHTVTGNSEFKTALCDSDSHEGVCDSSSTELLPMLAIGGSLGG
jgi:hypothetical protein